MGLLRRNVGGWALVFTLACGWLWLGCKQDARLAGEHIRHVEVGPVTDSGMTLDQEATPAQVAFALLRAIRDDVLAGNDRDAREKALDRQFNLCAPETIHRHYRRFFPASFPVDRDQSVHRTVRSWAPTLGLYVGSFDFDWATAQTRLRQRIGKAANEDGSQTAVVLLEAEHPSGDPNASVVIDIQLFREQGYWRVGRVGFIPKSRHLKPREAASTRPAGGAS